MEGSLTTIPLPFAKTIVLAVPRSIARSLENRLRSERGDQDIIGLLNGLRVNDASPRRGDLMGNTEAVSFSRGSSAGGAYAPTPFASGCTGLNPRTWGGCRPRARDRRECARNQPR